MLGKAMTILPSATARRSFATTTAVRLKRQGASASTSASQPVFKKDLRPPSAPPARSLPSPLSASDYAFALEEGRRSRGKVGSIYASYQALPYRTKLVFWTCGAGFAGMGLMVADKLEELFPARNNRSKPVGGEEEAMTARYIGYEKEENKPKLFSVSVVDRK
ncbi:hypothetical protein NDA11_005401 [Ustilago hordei]|uniref:uncharacterized protein n=1 Tax=Ustilago hordei TaxID=120017 RepID=UPI001A50143E|nr:uncharacterized protein UHO2_05728 [Ustilago hordei]KAJ1042094.1 hypothetical protein NDA10_004366 [Ustilago hordei]KAJ1573255.1 hypothetical protein NDA15_002774 [Ustilago hordei]KAJ1574875.1 hypothetical protein NDA12_007648 [Ustilago hordei]KAJ1576724.1 hypothetical protein NDA11_005401 [Ustilago hordei]KAJ1596246.1 hypothetical protein NDA14_002034 [Ustilago hordei]